MEKQRWICSCGTENTDSVCAKCGKLKPEAPTVNPAADYAEQYMKFQIKQQEMLQAQEEKKIARQEEKERKRREYEEKLHEYNAKAQEVPIKVIKQWAGSWIVLVLAILASVAAFCALISLFTNLSNGWFKLLVRAVKLLLSCLVCAGFWRAYAMGKRKNLLLDAGGARMLNGVLTFYQVIMYIVMIAVIGLFIAVFVAAKSCADNVTDGADKVDVDLSGFNSAFTGVLIGMLIVLIVVFVVLIIYFAKTTGFAKTVISSIETKSVSPVSHTMVAVLFFIVGGFALISAIGAVAASSMFSKFFEQLGDVGSMLSKLKLFGKPDIPNMLSQISNAGMYILGGVLALQFGGLGNKIRSEVELLEKPVLEN